MRDELVANVRSNLWMLFGAVGFVLLIACANVASLLLARATSRSREFAVRSALGAARGRLVGQLRAESMLLSFAGGFSGVLPAYWTLRAIPNMTAFDLPRAGEIHIDGIVLAFAAGLSLMTGILFGLAPSLGASRPDLMGVMRASGEASMGVSKRLLIGLTPSGLLVVGQVALSMMLLIGAALLMKSVAHLRGVNPGFNPAGLLTMRISLPQSRYDTDRKKTAFYEELIRRAELSPGIRSGVAAAYLPMMGSAGTPVQDARQAPLKLNERPIETIVPVTPGYFRTLDIPLKRGRDFTARDAEGSPRVTVIDEGLARQFWPGYPSGQDPVGQSLLIGGTKQQPAEIVGVVADVHQNLENPTWPGTVYVAFAQGAPQSAVVAVRTEGDPLRFAGRVRAEVLAIDSDQPISSVQTMNDLVESEIGPRRLIAILLASFAGVALLLAAIGIYGVIAYSVTQRTREMGIRQALGAQQGDILRLVVGQGLGLAVAGVALGIAGALALTRVMKSLLFHVSPTDPATFAGVALLFLLVALAASYIPARRATRVDPMAALRVW